MSNSPSNFGQALDERCPGYSFLAKFFVWLGLMSDFATKKRKQELAEKISEVHYERQCQDDELRRPAGAEPGGPVPFCLLNM